MKTFQTKTGIKSNRQLKRYMVIQLFVNSLRTRPVRKRFINFYCPVQQLTIETKPNAKQVP
jgi:hypothetical protein